MKTKNLIILRGIPGYIDKTMYTRNCPICNKEIHYKNESNKNNADKNNSICLSCNAKKNGWNKINKEVTDGIRKNAFKDKHHSEESKKQMSVSRLNNGFDYHSSEFRQTMKIASSGKNNPMYGKSFMDVWIKKYGLEEATIKYKAWKEKISKSTQGKNNPMYGKPIPKGCGKGVSGWYKNFYFRSLHELKFLLVGERFNLNIISCEKIKILYKNYDGTDRTYSPDYLVNNKFMVEIKPKKLFNTPNNLLKFSAAKIYCENHDLKFKIIDFGIIYNDELEKMINDKIITLNKQYEYKK